MPMYEHFPFFIIMLPMIAAIIIPLISKSMGMIKGLTMAVQILLVVFSAGLVLSLLGNGGASFNYAMGHFGAPWGNELRAGPLEALLSLAFALVMFFSLLGGSGDINRDIQDKRRYLYYLMMNLLTCSLMALVFTNDIFTAYVFIEINTVAACAIVVAKENGETVKATVKYCIMSVIGSGLFLLATSMLYGITGQLLMQPAHDAIQAIASDPTGQYMMPLTVTFLLYMASVAIKSALFPFHTWLPDAHGSATTSSSAVLSGLVLKGYIVLLIKLIYRVYGFEVIRNMRVLPVLFALGALAMVFGSIMAFRQKDLKRMIAYSSVAQIGYIFLGIGLGNAIGLTIACFHIIAHAFTKSMFFVSAGALINASGGKKEIADMGGAGRRDKVAGAAFIVGTLSMVGVPFFAGFATKFFLAEAAMAGEANMIVTLIVLAASTFLNALYYMPALLKLFASDDKPAGEAKARAGAAETFTLLFLIVANVALGVTFQPIMQIIAEGFKTLG